MFFCVCLFTISSCEFAVTSNPGSVILNIIHLWIIVLTAEWQMELLEMAFNPSQINGQQKLLPWVNGFLPQHCVDFLSSENINKNKSNYKYWLLYYTLCYSSYYLSNKMIFVTRPVKHWSFFMHSENLMTCWDIWIRKAKHFLFDQHGWSMFKSWIFDY